MARALYLLMTLFTREHTYTLEEYEMFLSFECLLTNLVAVRFGFLTLTEGGREVLVPGKYVFWAYKVGTP